MDYLQMVKHTPFLPTCSQGCSLYGSEDISRRVLITIELYLELKINGYLAEWYYGLVE